MAYYPDLSPYTYASPDAEPKTLNVGWLDVAYPYPRGDVPGPFLERLWRFCRMPIHMMRGFHTCELEGGCSLGLPPEIQRGDEVLRVGFGEIRVFGADEEVYAAPNLIYHYVATHHYLPPEAFVASVLQGPLPGSPAYEALARQCSWYEEYRRRSEPRTTKG